MVRCLAPSSSLEVSHEMLEAIRREHGDAFYLVDLDAFEANYRQFLEAFRLWYPNTNVAYSYKTNYTPILCREVHRWGGYAEVVSRLEYDLACRIGVPADRIIFNGPYKSADDLEYALTRGSTVNVDWPYQAAIIQEISRRRPHEHLSVGVRATFEVDGGGSSRFGFHADDEGLGSVIRRLQGLANVEVAGLHCHFLTLTRSPADYRLIARRMLQLAQQHFGGAPPRFVDIGGGFFSRMPEPLRAQFGVPIPTFQEYAEAIASQFAARYPAGPGPELIVEPGMALAADAVKFAARVVDTRRLHGRNLALVAASVYDVQPTFSPRQLPVQIVPGPGPAAPRVEGNVDVVGYTCLEQDVLCRQLEGSIAAGDYVVFDNVGAYTNVLKPPFIRGCSAMLGWSSRSNGLRLLRREEELDDLFRTYVF